MGANCPMGIDRDLGSGPCLIINLDIQIKDSCIAIDEWRTVGGEVDVDLCKKEQLGEIKAQIEDMLTDTRIQIRAITAEQKEKKDEEEDDYMSIQVQSDE